MNDKYKQSATLIIHSLCMFYALLFFDVVHECSIIICMYKKNDLVLLFNRSNHTVGGFRR